MVHEFYSTPFSNNLTVDAPYRHSNIDSVWVWVSVSVFTLQSLLIGHLYTHRQIVNWSKKFANWRRSGCMSPTSSIVSRKKTPQTLNKTQCELMWWDNNKASRAWPPPLNRPHPLLLMGVLLKLLLSQGSKVWSLDSLRKRVGLGLQLWLEEWL